MGNCASKREESTEEEPDNQPFLQIDENENPNTELPDEHGPEGHRGRHPFPRPGLLTREAAIDRLGTLRTLINFSDIQIHDHLSFLEARKVHNEKVETALQALQQEIQCMIVWVKDGKVKSRHLEKLTAEIDELENVCWSTQALLTSIDRLRRREYGTFSSEDSILDVPKKAEALAPRLWDRRAALAELLSSMQMYNLMKRSSTDNSSDAAAREAQRTVVTGSAGMETRNAYLRQFGYLGGPWI